MRCEDSLDEIPANGWTDLTGDRERETLPQSCEQLGARRPGRRLRPRPRGDRNPVPPQRLFFRAPLPLEVIGARVARRSAEVESRAAIGARRLDGLPVE